MNRLTDVRIPNRRQVSVDAHSDWLGQLADHHSWQGVYAMGRRPAPTKPLDYKGWRVVPLEQDRNLTMPTFARERFDEIEALCPGVMRWVVIHEPIKKPLEPEKAKTIRQILLGLALAMVVIPVLMGMLALVVAIVAVVVPMLLLGLLVIGALVMGVDPVLVAVTPSNTWVAIAAWVEEEDGQTSL